MPIKLPYDVGVNGLSDSDIVLKYKRYSSISTKPLKVSERDPKLKFTPYYRHSDHSYSQFDTISDSCSSE